MIDYRHLCFYDFETSSAKPETTQILQIGAVIVNRNSLKIVDEFSSLVKPDDMDAVEDDALRVNHITREQLQTAPSVDLIFPAWAKWIQQYNTTANKTGFGAPIPCGYGIDRFDVPIVTRYAKRFGYWDAKRDEMNLLNPVFSFDVMKWLWMFTRTNPEPANLKLSTVAEWMGISKEEIETQAHNAVWDVKTTAKIGIKFMNLCKFLTSYNEATEKRRLEFAGCLSDQRIQESAIPT